MQRKRQRVAAAEQVVHTRIGISGAAGIGHKRRIRRREVGNGQATDNVVAKPVSETQVEVVFCTHCRHCEIRIRKAERSGGKRRRVVRAADPSPIQEYIEISDRVVEVAGYAVADAQALTLLALLV